MNYGLFMSILYMKTGWRGHIFGDYRSWPIPDRLWHCRWLGFCKKSPQKRFFSL